MLLRFSLPKGARLGQDDRLDANSGPAAEGREDPSYCKLHNVTHWCHVTFYQVLFSEGQLDQHNNKAFLKGQAEGKNFKKKRVW